MDPIVISSIGSGVGNIGGGLLANIGAKKRDKRAFRMSIKQAEHANQMNIQNWQRMNEYNLPIRQRERMEEAGYNPNLFYGQGSPGNAEKLGDYQQVRPDFNYQPVDFSGTVNSMLDLYSNLKVKNAQADSLRATSELTREKALTEAVLRYGKGHENVSKRVRAWLDDNLKEKMLNRYSVETDNILADTRVKKATADLTELKAIWQRLENNLMREGLTSSNNPVFKFVVQAMREQGLDPKKVSWDLWKGFIDKYRAFIEE